MATNVHFRANNGMYMSADNGGGGSIYANRALPAQWETFTIVDPDGPPLNLGEQICIQVYDCLYMCAEGGGGGTLDANRVTPFTWESFRIQPTGGVQPGTPLTNGQQVAIQTYNGNFLCAENGGGSIVDATRTAVGPWETFTVEVLGPAPVRQHQGPDIINNDSNQFMESTVIFSDSGILSFETHTWTRNALYGFHGGAVAFFVDIADNIIANTDMYVYGVDGTWIPGLPSSVDMVQTPTFSQDIFNRTASIMVYHKYAPKNQLLTDIHDLIYVGQQIANVIKAIKGA